MMFTTSKRLTMRYPPHKSVNPVRSSIIQDLRLLPIDSSPVYLAVSEYISLSLCVFRGQVRVSSHVNQQEHVKQQEAAKPCQIGKIVCFLHSKKLPFKKFRAPPRTPLGGSTPPRPPPAKHLHSPLGMPLRWFNKFKKKCPKQVLFDPSEHVGR